ncbi:MAG TPA: 4-hydroxythreonine-4-phosphate dehydrogenase PdxA [Microvirga sp.]|jgi:4-hydroxythreonine-4-phosphate dehydrogenase|nr:4-hydroxythreonine-4-phosphate dehydrogenase PdxA [Microvirga sp.]
MHTQDGRPIIAISSGDPAGIGPEITLKALASEAVQRACAPVIVGSAAVVRRDLALVPARLELRAVGSPTEVRGEPGTVEVLEMDGLDLAACPRGEVSPEGGRFSGHSVGRAIGLAMQGAVHSVVVSPNNKQAMHAGGHEHTGFEEIARHYTGAKTSIQILMGNKYVMSRVTNHVPLRKVPDLCTRERVLAAIRMLHKSLQVIGHEAPVIGVAGLNPHCGEHGLMGDEEIIHIGPACDDARAAGIKVLGPLPGDTIFNDYEKFGLNAVLSMYHDHGNACMKMAEFGELVNFIGGLPVPVFTVSHGTAFDIAGKGIADATNMELSIRAAARSQRVAAKAA